ncbi:hypothetical protein N7481_010334 [Penicillium waksmanii]|uniref:uncharacterized protein n=1 Tax=Penicillium waksmanii TaxID=69791 RepID=UPI00254946C3|nr:uncharacterized protein N7481_010334 [Penicillium waksmanii]KAJ5976627.1 hypothetical protein N7481_010334 [Penicillium waksmanii]
MPSRSQEYTDRGFSPSVEADMDIHLPNRRSSPIASAASNSVLELPRDRSDWGLATYSHDRGNVPETRSFSFRDDEVRSVAFNRGYPADRDEDRRSNCTSFDGLDNVQSPDRIKHCYTNTAMDHSARVFNGDIARAYDPSSTREHHLHGGSVKNESRLVNGDLDRETFLAFFCNSDNEAHRRGSHREETRHRRRGPRGEGRALPQHRV